MLCVLIYYEILSQTLFLFFLLTLRLMEASNKMRKYNVLFSRKPCALPMFIVMSVIFILSLQILSYFAFIRKTSSSAFAIPVLIATLITFLVSVVLLIYAILMGKELLKATGSFNKRQRSTGTGSNEVMAMKLASFKRMWIYVLFLSWTGRAPKI